MDRKDQIVFPLVPYWKRLEEFFLTASVVIIISLSPHAEEISLYQSSLFLSQSKTSSPIPTQTGTNTRALQIQLENLEPLLTMNLYSVAEHSDVCTHRDFRSCQCLSDLLCYGRGGGTRNTGPDRGEVDHRVCWRKIPAVAEGEEEGSAGTEAGDVRQSMRHWKDLSLRFVRG